ncbi:MAG: ssDNA-binding domain-containing protein [Solobacterium sp.]|nr:ssDNA-binding domain-containing protein [Solobacterium sp.]
MDHYSLDGITDELEKGVMNVFSCDSYRAYLAVMARFHTYSINNSILIWMQRPDATLVAGYNTWLTRFSRNVKKGEKGIRILAPVRKKILDEDMQERSVLSGFRTAVVFDISQTEGKELPSYVNDRLPGIVTNYPMFICSLILVSPAEVRFEKTNANVHGFYRTTDQVIVVSDTLSQIMTVKTLLHEITHAILHSRNHDGSREARMLREIEAESVAYAVSRYYGIDTSAYSFGYIAGWSGSKEIPELRSSLSRIQETTSMLIDMIDMIQSPAKDSRNLVFSM